MKLHEDMSDSLPSSPPNLEKDASLDELTTSKSSKRETYVLHISLVAQNDADTVLSCQFSPIVYYSSPMASLVLTDSSQLIVDGFEKLPETS
uniref:Uncharacterized protein n=1 Tax=Timema monikensis TaxID=170555 RepID=A0A7R9E9L0_9NEOP|nr:unnamed protein product [Timema monikensis]